MITPEQFAERMRAYSMSGDMETSHGDADDLMCEVLSSLGYGDGVKIFTEMDKWYA